MTQKWVRIVNGIIEAQPIAEAENYKEAKEKLRKVSRLQSSDAFDVTEVRRIVDVGKILDHDLYQDVGNIEFKRFQVRVGCFQVGNRWLLTHGFIKKTHKWPNSELKRAERIMQEHLDREQRGRR
jgi:hypothetical protein